MHAALLNYLKEQKKKIQENKANGIKLKLEHQIHILFAFVEETKHEREKNPISHSILARFLL